jgi:exonuclease SbcC
MITKIQIQNFQSHKDTTLLLDDGVNILLGGSDSGKSAIVRALNFVISNRPLGDSFIRNKQSFVEVIIHTDDGYIKRHRGRNDNYYEINGTEFKAFGTNPPVEVFQFLKIDDINLQKQMDTHYLLGDSSALSKFNQVTNLSKLSEATLSITNEINWDTREVQLLAKNIDEKQIQLNNLKDTLPGSLQLFKRAHKLSKINETQQEVLKQAGRYFEIQVEINSYSRLEEYESALNRIQSMSDSQNLMEKQHLYANKLLLLLRSMPSNEKLSEYSEKLDSIIRLKNTIQPDYEKLIKIKKLRFEYQNTLRKIKETQIELGGLQKQFDKLNTIICSKCGNKIQINRAP